VLYNWALCLTDFACDISFLSHAQNSTPLQQKEPKKNKKPRNLEIDQEKRNRQWPTTRRCWRSSGQRGRPSETTTTRSPSRYMPPFLPPATFSLPPDPPPSPTPPYPLRPLVLLSLSLSVCVCVCNSEFSEKRSVVLGCR
jgi:hypothetical protein